MPTAEVEEGPYLAGSFIFIVVGVITLVVVLDIPSLILYVQLN